MEWNKTTFWQSYIKLTWYKWCNTVSLQLLNSTISYCTPIDIDTKKAFYTYYKGGLSHIQSCLDYGLCSKPFLDFWSMISCCTLLLHHSNQHLLLLISSIARPRGPRSFQFHGMWLHLNFLDLVHATWKLLSKLVP